jgi:hypothetical protein
MKPAANLTEYTDNGIIYLHTTDTGIEDVRELNSLALLLEKFLRSPETDMPKPVMISVEHTAAAISEQFVCIKSAA